MNPKKILSALLAALMLLPVFTACGESAVQEKNDPQGTPADSTTVTPGGETEPAETEPDVFDGLETTDMDGQTFTFLTSNWPGEAVWTVDDITAEEYTGAAVNDAVYDRNLKTEERLKCVIQEHNVPGSGDAVNALQTSVAAADGAYQVWIARLHEYLNMAANGCIMDMKNIEGIDLSRPAWVQNSIKGLSILNHNFGVCSEITTIHKEAVSSIVFNKNLAAQYQLDDLYEVVSDGKWTLDYFAGIVEMCSRDLDGDGEMTDKDQWGFFYQRDTLDAFLAAGQGMICDKDENDRPRYIFDNERNIDILMNSTDIMYNRAICYNVMNAPGDFNIWMANKFMQDEAMFMWVRDVNIPELRTMESDFGILPNPKFNDAVDNYYSVVNSYTGAALCVPTIVDERTEKNLGLFLETMGAASLDTLSKAYYDIMLNGIVARDRESSRMLDIIYANTTYDAGSIGAYAGICDYIYMAMSYANTFASYSAARKKAVEKDIGKICEKIEKRFGTD